jgi:hypothetical protein
MPEPLTTYVTRVDDEMKTIGFRWDYIIGSLATLHDRLTAEGCPNSGDVCQTIRTDLIGIMREYDTNFGWYRGRLGTALSWIDSNWSVGGEVTMDAILTAMVTSDFDELQKFIGLVDAYRVAIWNAPFNAEFYGALARGFSTWPQY